MSEKPYKLVEEYHGGFPHWRIVGPGVRSELITAAEAPQDQCDALNSAFSAGQQSANAGLVEAVGCVLPALEECEIALPDPRVETISGQMKEWRMCCTMVQKRVDNCCKILRQALSTAGTSGKGVG